MTTIEKKTVIKGPGFLTLLGLAFIVLKLCGVIAWPWWWVTLPLWGGAAVVLIVCAFILLGMAAVGIGALLVAWLESRNAK